MIDLIEELEKVMRERGISPEDASRFIGCTAKSVYRWIEGESKPNMVYMERIRQAITEIKRNYKINEKSRRGYAHLLTLKTFYPDLKLNNIKRAINILADLTPDELGEIYVSGMDKAKVKAILKKHKIE